jgi:glycosyltransferase involved in cell wall biosynthesis
MGPRGALRQESQDPAESQIGRRRGTAATVKIGIVSLQPEEWNSLWRPAHFVQLGLARRWPVIWVDPAREWRDAIRSGGRQRFRRPISGRQLEVYTPPSHLPRVYRPRRLRRAIERVRLGQSIDRLRHDGCEQIVLYAWRPEYLECVDLVPHDLLVYHVVDEYSYAPDDPPTPDHELRMIRRADQVILHSPGLVEKKGGIAPDKTAQIPNGVAFARFAAPTEEPPELRGIPRPRIGYVGAFRRQINWDLLRILVAAHPEWHWVFVGEWLESHIDLAPQRAWLEGRPNVHFAGSMPAARLGEFAGHLDVGILPYVEDGYTRHIYPMKLHEYLAAGLPTVGTPIRTLRDFSGTIELARSVKEWEAAIGDALAPGQRSPAAVERRRAVAKAHDWDVLVDRIAGLIEEGLARKLATANGSG